jgi:ABC-type uncharacterized transport system permease subunit
VAKEKKPKKGKKGDAPQNEWPEISISAHPRARRSIQQTKAWAGLIAFAIVGYLSHNAGVDSFEVGVRALVAGIAVYLFAWAVSVAFWQRMVVHEAKAVAERRRDERLEAMQRMMNPEATSDDEEATA